MQYAFVSVFHQKRMSLAPAHALDVSQWNSQMRRGTVFAAFFKSVNQLTDATTTSSKSLRKLYDAFTGSRTLNHQDWTGHEFALTSHYK